MRTRNRSGSLERLSCEESGRGKGGVDAVRNREAGRPGRGEEEVHVDECW